MPKLSKEMNDALNKQVKIEMDSYYIYKAMAFWYDSKELQHLANYYKLQANEEMEHADKFANFILETDGDLKFLALDAPKSEYASVDEALEAALKHEEFVTGTIYSLYKIMEEMNELQCKPMLDWFVNEQIEEEDNARRLITLRSYMSNDFMFDHRTKRLRDGE